jgi:hypothetical protein
MRGAIRGIGPQGNMRCGMLASGLNRRATVRASPRIVSGSATAARYSTCTAPTRYWSTFLTLRRQSANPLRYAQRKAGAYHEASRR